MAIIKEEQIEEKKSIIEASTNNLVIASKEFSSTITKLTEIVTDLKIVLNTTGGETQIAKLNKIDFEADVNSLNELAIQKQNIKVTILLHYAKGDFYEKIETIQTAHSCCYVNPVHAFYIIRTCN